MKRPVPTDTPVATHSTRRRRILSEEEHQLWESVARQAKPLRKKPRVVKASEAPAAHPPPPPAQSSQAASSAKPVKPAKPNHAPSMPPLAPLGRRERSQLSRGKTEIDARLDLHGMTQTRAHRALLHFLQQASGDGLRFVLVITGKGRTMGPESGAGMAESAGISHHGGRLRGSAYRPWRRRRALRENPAREVIVMRRHAFRLGHPGCRATCLPQRRATPLSSSPRRRGPITPEAIGEGMLAVQDHDRCPYHARHGVWVPAFAGTTVIVG
jgi:DNA-nicking Smr family endonuclease